MNKKNTYLPNEVIYCYYTKNMYKNHKHPKISTYESGCIPLDSEKIKILVSTYVDKVNSINGEIRAGALTDPVSASLETMLLFKNNFSDWESSEKRRRVNKSFMNLTGYLQQNLLGTLDGCESNPTGSGKPDIVFCSPFSPSVKIIAEVKNKYTINSDQAAQINLTMRTFKSEDYKEYEPFFVKIIDKVLNTNYDGLSIKSSDISKLFTTKNGVHSISGRVFYAFLSFKEFDSTWYAEPGNLSHVNLLIKSGSIYAFDCVMTQLISSIEKTLGFKSNYCLIDSIKAQKI